MNLAKKNTPALWENFYLCPEFIHWSRSFVLFFNNLRWSNHCFSWSRGANIYVYGSNLLGVEFGCGQILSTYWFLKTSIFFVWK